MILRYIHLLALPYFYLASAASFDCQISRPPLRWDLTALPRPQVANRTRHIPPSVERDEVEFDLCATLASKDGVGENDQCPMGTRACMRTMNTKNGRERITRVIPIAGDFSEPPAQLDPVFSPGWADDSSSLSILLHGPPYPPQHTPGVPHSLNITLRCAEVDSAPKFVSYSSWNGVVRVSWDARAACAIRDDGSGGGGDGGGGAGGGGDTGSKRGGSGVGWFFLVLFLAVLAYFGLGAYYNYTQYGASGWDLVPHRDFWRDVPYLVRDIMSHLYSMLRPGGGRGGYTAV